MCAGAAFWTQIGRIVYGARDEKRGYTLISSSIVHPKTQIVYGVMETECSKLLKDYFALKRDPS
jgi:tRNA(adenine34) deaminase